MRWHQYLKTRLAHFRDPRKVLPQRDSSGLSVAVQELLKPEHGRGNLRRTSVMSSEAASKAAFCAFVV
eukprot:COSAG02_NODE_832_length_16660_cov_16.228006_22_plen_68_part_00